MIYRFCTEAMQSDLRRRRPVPLADGAQEVEESSIGVARARCEAEDRATNVALMEGRAGVDRAGQKAFAERAKRNHANPEFLERG